MMKREYFSKPPLPGLMAWLGLAVLFCPGFSLGASLDHNGASTTPPPTTQVSHRAAALRQNQPLYFIENKGQAKNPVKYYHNGLGPGLWFTDKEISLMAEPGPDPGKAVVRLQPLGMSSGVKLQGAKPQAGKINFFAGRDPAKWRTGIPIYSEVVYREAYPGTDLIFYGISHKVEYDVILRPGADPSRVKFRCQGVKAMTLRSDGSLALRLPNGEELVQSKPRVYQKIGGQRLAREGTYTIAKLGGAWTYGFEVGPYDRDHPLVIDPVLGYSSYLGGSGVDEVRGIAVDPSGNAYLTGRTTSVNFPPLTSGLSGSDDCFVTKIDAQGKLVYSTYLGGSENDAAYDNEGGNAIATDAAGNAYIAGYTWSIDFPTTINAFQTSNHGQYDAFIAKLDPAGVLVFSSYLGGNTMDIAGRAYDGSATSYGGNAVAVDAAGNMYVVGYTDSGHFPVTDGAFQTRIKGSDDAFVAKISPSGVLLYCTFLGGSENDITSYNEGANGIAVDAAGNAYVTGYTWSTDFPAGVMTPYQSENLGEYDVFVAKLNATGSSLLYSSYVGGKLSDEALGIAVDEAGNIYLAGRTESADFPSLNGFQMVLNGSDDAFALKFNADGTLAWSTFCGGSENEPAYINEGATGIARDQYGNIYLSGFSWCTDFPTLNPIQAKNRGSYDAFVTKIGPHGNKLSWSTYLGGAAQDEASCLTVDARGKVYVGGVTTSSNFPLKLPFQSSLRGSRDGFVTQINQTVGLEGVMGLLLLDN